MKNAPMEVTGLPAAESAARVEARIFARERAMPLPSAAVTQVAYVTTDLARSMRYWMETMRAGPFFVMRTPPGFHMSYRGRPGADTIVAGVAFCGTCNIEIVQPSNDAPSIFREVLDDRGEGLHHVQPHMGGLSAAEFQQRFDGYLAQGIELASYADVPGTGRTAFFDDRQRTGAFIELIEFAGDSFAVIERMYEAHLAWDGDTRTREYADLFG